MKILAVCLTKTAVDFKPNTVSGVINRVFGGVLGLVNALLITIALIFVLYLLSSVPSIGAKIFQLINRTTLTKVLFDTVGAIIIS